jgi:hypothetical protein
LEFGQVIPAAPASPFIEKAKLPEVGALTRAMGEIAITIIINNPRVSVIENCRGGFSIFFDFVKRISKPSQRASEALF